MDGREPTGADLLPLAGEGVDGGRRRRRGTPTVASPLIRLGCAEAPSPAGGRRARRPLAIGLGFRKAATADTLATLVRDALSRLPADLAAAPATLATIAEKDRPALRDAAALLGLPLVILPKSALAGTEDRITVASEAARACLGVPSVAEAAALAAAGPGARLLMARIATADATCAIALSPEAS